MVVKEVHEPLGAYVANEILKRIAAHPLSPAVTVHKLATPAVSPPAPAP